MGRPSISLNHFFPPSHDRNRKSKSENTHFRLLLPNLLLMMWTPHPLSLQLIPDHLMPVTQLGARARSMIPAAAAGSPAVFDV